MIKEIFLAIIQATSEFLPISSSGHLAFVSKLISTPDLFFFTMLHLASLFAIIFFLRKELLELVKFNKESRKVWKFWILATIPAAIVGFLFNDIIESAFDSYLFLGLAFIFTGCILFLTKFMKVGKKELNIKSSLKIGLAQCLALFPGVSRSGMTISTGLFSGVNREKAAKFSFLLFIPLSIGAFILEFIKLEIFYFNWALLISFLICMILSFLFLKLLLKIIKQNRFWLFSFYCWAIGIVSFILFFLKL